LFDLKTIRDRLPIFLFIASCVAVIFAYGVVVGRFKIFPFGILSAAQQGYKLLRLKQNPDYASYILNARNQDEDPVKYSGEAYKGVNLVTRIGKDLKLIIEVISMDGDLLNRWTLDWFDLWPNPEHVPSVQRPKSRPGTQLHGAVLLDNGDLVFNFDGLGLMRVDPQGKVVWRLPYQTHHSITLDDSGNLWVCGQRECAAYKSPSYGRSIPYDEDSILVVSTAGKILQEWSVEEILKKNDREGLLLLGSYVPPVIGEARGDLLHLNDVEPFPLTMKEGFFNKEDVIVSLRNVNTVFVFNRKTGRIKYVTTGMFVWQHDPDFIDGDTFSVFDNNRYAGFSRIVTVSGKENSLKVYYEGSERKPFYSDVMGKHQWLPNGNLLVTETMAGRAFEINEKKEIVWQYINFVKKGKVGIVEEVRRYPLRYGRFYTRKRIGKE
jgi:hypothetical protein